MLDLLENMVQYGFREVIPTKILKQNYCETSCYGCEFCIKFCEKNNLIRQENMEELKEIPQIKKLFKEENLCVQYAYKSKENYNVVYINSKLYEEI